MKKLVISITAFALMTAVAVIIPSIVAEAVFH